MLAVADVCAEHFRLHHIFSHNVHRSIYIYFAMTYVSQKAHAWFWLNWRVFYKRTASGPSPNSGYSFTRALEHSHIRRRNIVAEWNSSSHGHLAAVYASSAATCTHRIILCGNGATAAKNQVPNSTKWIVMLDSSGTLNIFWKSRFEYSARPINSVFIIIIGHFIRANEMIETNTITMSREAAKNQQMPFH